MDIFGNIVLNIFGNVFGSVFGNVFGNVFENLFGNVFGNVFGNMFGRYLRLKRHQARASTLSPLSLDHQQGCQVSRYI